MRQPGETLEVYWIGVPLAGAPPSVRPPSVLEDCHTVLVVFDPK
jgi:hypothetical protein